MIETIKNIIRIKAAVSVNVFIYYFKRLFLVGRLMPDSAYANQELKKGLTIVVAILGQIYTLLKKAMYVLIAAGLPVMFMSLDGRLTKDRLFDSIVSILFFLSCILGPLIDSVTFNINQNKVICIKYLHMKPRNYVLASLLIMYVPYFIYFIPVLIATALISGGSVTEALLMWFAMFSFRMLGEALQLWIYDRKGFVLHRKTGFVWLMIPLGLAAAYYPVYAGWSGYIAKIIFNPVSVLAYTILGAIGIYYIVSGYKNFGTKYNRSIDLKYLMSNLKEEAKKKAFTAVEVKETDLNRSKSDLRNISALKGYSYMNALFFARHRRQLLKPVYSRLVFAGLAFAAGVIFYITNPDNAVRASQQMYRILPVIVFLMYAITVTDKACKAMFYNCDISLLRFGFYRKPQAILNNFFIRLIRIGSYNLAVGFAICLAIIGFLAICKTPFLTPDMFMFFMAILLLSVFFTVHHLFLYYVFQPYSTGLEVKNPYFKLLNFIVYIISYICFQVRMGGTAFALGVLAFTALYIVIALAVVYKYAPTHFRVK